MKHTSNVLKLKGKKKMENILKNENIAVSKPNKKRVCLKCGTHFFSKGRYNRICEKCTMVNQRIAPDVYAVSSKSPDESSFFESEIYKLN